MSKQLRRGDNRSGWRWGRPLLVTVSLVLSLGLTGCGSELSKEFRAAAIGGIETGVNAIVGGLLDGLFTIADPAGPEGVQ